MIIILLSLRKAECAHSGSACSRISIVPADIVPRSYLLQYPQPAAAGKRQLREERFRNVPRERERSGRVRGNLRSDSAASSGMMSPFSAAAAAAS